MKKNSAARIGFTSSLFVACLGVIYILFLISYIINDGFVFPPPPYVELAVGIITFLTASGLVILFTAIRFVNEQENKILGSLGISFIVMFALSVSINRFVQLTVIQQNLPDVPADLVRFLPYDTGSVMLAMEVLGWGFFSSIAALIIAPLFSSTRLNLAIRWTFVLYSLFSFMSVVGFATDFSIPLGPIAWGPILLVLCILLAVYFRKYDEQEI